MPCCASRRAHESPRDARRRSRTRPPRDRPRAGRAARRGRRARTGAVPALTRPPPARRPRSRRGGPQLADELARWPSRPARDDRQRHVHRHRTVPAEPVERNGDRVEPDLELLARVRNALAADALQARARSLPSWSWSCGVSASYGSRPAVSRASSSASCASRHLPSAVQCTGSRRPVCERRVSRRLPVSLTQVERPRRRRASPGSRSRPFARPARAGGRAPASGRRRRGAGGAAPEPEPQAAACGVAHQPAALGEKLDEPVYRGHRAARAARRSPSESARVSRRRTARGCRGRARACPPTPCSQSAKVAFAYRLWKDNPAMGRTQADARVETLPYSWYADPAVARRRARPHLPALLAVRGPHRRARRPGQHVPHPGGRPAGGRRARPRGRAARLPQRLPAPRHHARQRAADARHDPVPVPRLDLRPRRRAARRAAQQGRAGLRHGRSSGSCRSRWTRGGRSCS